MKRVGGEDAVIRRIARGKVEETAKAGYYRDMESRNARFLRQGLIEKYRKMTPAQRVKAFVEHSRQMKTLRDAGALRRKSPEQGKAGHG